MYVDDYDKIMLSAKEKQILKQIIKKKEVTETFCNDTQKTIFLRHDLIRITQDQTVTSAGRVANVSGTGRIQATDKAYRYILYQRDSYFKGKLPVIIALVALIKSFDVEICRLANFIANWLSSL